MKKFKQVIAENGPIPGAGSQAVFGRNPSSGSFSPSVVKKINAIIGSYVAEDLIDPMSALTRIRGSLSNIGLTFPAVSEDMMVEQSGSIDLPLTLFGGRFGKDTDTPYDQFLDDDGLSNTVEGGLSLNITYETTDTNQCRLRASIK
jgi:hypothetical protein|tara:strand:+ start:41 stop:478 length:438 start_codon:yes stop_codon:yes gene_type:complete